MNFQLTYHDRHLFLPVSIENKTVWLGVEICIDWWESIDTLLAVFTKLHVTCNSSYPHMNFGKFSRLLCAKWSARRPTFTGKFLAFRNACQARERTTQFLSPTNHTHFTDWIFPENSDLLGAFTRGISSSDSSLWSSPGVVEYISPPRLPMVLVKNDWFGMPLCMPDGPESWYSVCTERKLRTNREIMTAVISWLKDAPMALRSAGASCRRYQ